MKDFIVHSPSSEATLALGRSIANLLFPGAVVALEGELGAGKTTFTRGVLEGMGVQGYLHSPSFSLVNEYPGSIYHLDLYRLEDAAAETSLDWEEYLEGQGVALVEWAGRFPELLPPERLEVYLTQSSDESRVVTFTARGAAYEKLLRQLQNLPMPAGEFGV